MAAVPAVAHHSFAAEYHSNKPVSLTGTVTKMEWTNPHARFYADVKAADGTMVNWEFELGGSSGLVHGGDEFVAGGDAVGRGLDDVEEVVKPLRLDALAKLDEARHVERDVVVGHCDGARAVLFGVADIGDDAVQGMAGRSPAIHFLHGAEGAGHDAAAEPLQDVEVAVVVGV